MRVVIAGGGTGGHLFPGMAVAEELKRRDPSIEILFIGSESGIEARVIPGAGYPIRLLRTQGVLGKDLMGKAVSLFRMARATKACMDIYEEAKPDIVIGTGGYASFAPVAAARLSGVPTLLMEQNMVPGLANKALARVADAVAVTYFESMAHLPRGKAHRTGNPVRASIMKGDRERALDLFQLDANRLTVLVLGGSAGASSINEAVLGSLSELLDIRDKVQLLHQTGQRDYERVRRAIREMGYRAMVAPFIQQMAEAYAVADIVISRAGATTLAEVTAIGKPLILIPYPYAAGHQKVNAKKLLEIGACRLIDEGALDGRSLAAEIRELYSSEELRGKMRRQSRSIGKPDAAERVVDLVGTLIRQRETYV